MSNSKLERVFITVKTAPTISTKYKEVVCTAGIREDGSWIRIYPITLKSLRKENKISKYQWIECMVVRNTRDPRHESYKLLETPKALNKIDASNNWQKRKDIVLSHVYSNLEKLIVEARNVNIYTSLATFKPSQIYGFYIERRNKRELYNSSNFIPYKFFYGITDENGKRSRMQILDWEIHQLCDKLIKTHGDRQDIILNKLKSKYFYNFKNNRNLHLFLGTTKCWHIRRSNNPFVIIGIFCPPQT